jgi:hypothetical protein
MFCYKRITTLVLALLLMLLAGLVACGGDDDADDAGGSLFPGSNEDSDGNEEDGGDDDDADLEDTLNFGEGTAVVTIGSDRYEFSTTTETIDGELKVGVCQVLFGLIHAVGFATDGRPIELDLEIPPVDWESYTDGRFDNSSPKVRVEVEGEERRIWVADERHTDSEGNSPSSVDDWQIDGGRASGTVTFYDSWAYVTGATSDPVEGTFEIACETD